MQVFVCGNNFEMQGVHRTLLLHSNAYGENGIVLHIIYAESFHIGMTNFSNVNFYRLYYWSVPYFCLKIEYLTTFKTIIESYHNAVANAWM